MRRSCVRAVSSRNVTATLRVAILINESANTVKRKLLGIYIAGCADNAGSERTLIARGRPARNANYRHGRGRDEHAHRT